MIISRRAEARLPDLAVAGYDFLRTEIHTGLTLAGLAADAKKSPAKMKRNLVNARKAHDSVLRFIHQVPLTPQQYTEIQKKFKKLKSALQELGEEV